MKYTTYLFDFDYTLADSSRGIVICFRNVLERHGHTGISDEAIKRTIGKTLEDSFSILSGITTPETLAEYKKEGNYISLCTRFLLKSRVEVQISTLDFTHKDTNKLFEINRFGIFYLGVSL